MLNLFTLNAKGILLLFKDVMHILNNSIHQCKIGFYLLVMHIVLLWGRGSNAPQVVYLVMYTLQTKKLMYSISSRPSIRINWKSVLFHPPSCIFCFLYHCIFIGLKYFFPKVCDSRLINISYGSFHFSFTWTYIFHHKNTAVSLNIKCPHQLNNRSFLLTDIMKMPTVTKFFSPFKKEKEKVGWINKTPPTK